MRIMDWSSDVCSSDLAHFVLEVLDGLLGLLDQVCAPLQQALAEVLELKCAHVLLARTGLVVLRQDRATGRIVDLVRHDLVLGLRRRRRRLGHDGDGNLAHRTRRERRSEEQTSELQSLMSTSYAVL